MRLTQIGALALAVATFAEAREPPEDYQSRTCADDWVCVYALATDSGGVRFRGRNLSDYPVTVALKVRPENLTAQGADRRALTLPAGADEPLIDYRVVKRRRSTDYRYSFEWALGNLRVDHDDDYIYRFPYADGKRYYVLQGYGSRFSHVGNERHTVDFNMAVGTPVHAARDGVVAKVVERHGEGCWARRCMSTANYIVVLHADGSTGEYYHLVKNGALVAPGERVSRGQKIALSGNSGHTTMPHLHFGVYRVNERGLTKSIPVVFDSDDGRVATPRRGPGYVAR